MKILLCHNHYQQHGGEDESFADEAWLLESRGHEVIRFTVHNNVIEQMGRWQLAQKTIWNQEAYVELRDLIHRRRPDILHCTNTFPLISPAAYYAARSENVPVVQALRNYRMLCANALFLRDGRICEDCLGKSTPWPAVMHGCYRNSRCASTVVTLMVSVHRAMRTWSDAVTTFYTLTEFARKKFIQGGLPADRIVVKSNFVHPDDGPGEGEGGYVVFVGRLSEEKGIGVLLSAWSELKSDVRLKVVGDGPLAQQVAEAQKRDPRIQWLGHRSREHVAALMGDATCLVMPSICYETFGRTIAEAYSRGTPVIASNRGAMSELVMPGQTGLLFDPGNPVDLANAVGELLGNPTLRTEMRRNARAEYERNHTAESNYRQLMALYERALGRPGNDAEIVPSLGSMPLSDPVLPTISQHAV
jgi:glycosyltransferase involved in cell wall biosynthesis